MPFGPDNVQTAGNMFEAVKFPNERTDFFIQSGILQSTVGMFNDGFTEFYIGSTAGHIGGDGNGVRLSGLGHDFSFLSVMFGVEYIVRDPFAL